ncbi:MAG: type II/IV secretion system protein [Planctomycetes bacterium]|nr:type II/IV secretion system protein [Planctomycetota bacterium]
MLAAAGLVSEAQLREGRAHQRNKGIRIGEALVQLGHLDEVTVTRMVAKQNAMPFVDLAKGTIPAATLARVPAELALEQGMLPVKDKENGLIVAVDDQLKRIVADQLSFLLGCEVTVALAAPAALQAALRRYYGGQREDTVARAMGAEEGDTSDAPIVRLATRMFKEALDLRASDIHIEPKGSVLRVRYRVDGVLRTIAEHPPHLAAPLISRLKIMGSMDIAEKRKPQDGRIELTIDGREVDVRASILPSNHGESMVLRLLDRGANLIGLREMGFEEDDYAQFKRLIQRPHGIVLVTGPTGSGKTTTLYGALAELNRPDVKIITAEDPVEYHIQGINQVQVNTKIGLTFARILKAMLRCAPNVILVGEIRDIETAEVAIQAALTGHLVFSTLHTNDAPSAITRLLDMGVQPFLVSSAVQGVVAQRLVRRVCKECKESYAPELAELRVLGLDPALVAGCKFARGRGCRACEGSGFRGRLALFELFELDSDLRDAVFRGEPLERIRASALASGRLRPLIHSGTSKILAGLTTVTEVLRVTRAAVEG